MNGAEEMPLFVCLFVRPCSVNDGHQASAETNLKKVSLELGGKSALIVCKDADLDEAATAAHVGLFLNMGQCCVASSRIFVHEDVAEAFTAKVGLDERAITSYLYSCLATFSFLLLFRFFHFSSSTSLLLLRLRLLALLLASRSRLPWLPQTISCRTALTCGMHTAPHLWCAMGCHAQVVALAKTLRQGASEGHGAGAIDLTVPTAVPVCDLGPQVDKIQFDKVSVSTPPPAAIFLSRLSLSQTLFGLIFDTKQNSL